MGRRAHLERLALGRSAFQDEPARPEDPNGELDHVSGSTTEDIELDNDYRQQYDSKGRPINPATEARNQAMRDAQNGVLAVVGVVEAKATADNDLNHRLYSKQKARAKLLKAEQARGELVDLVTSFLGVALTWWPEAVVRRVQIGLYPRSLSFADILSEDLSAAQKPAIVAAASVFLAGAPAAVLCVGLKLLLRWGLEQCVGRLETWLNARLDESTFEQADRAIKATAEVGYFAIDAALLPLNFYGTTQQLGLTSSQQWLPCWDMLSPWNPHSMHSFIWKSAIDISLVGKLCSPAVLIIFKDWLRQDQGLRMLYKGPASSDLPIDEPYSNIIRGGLDQDWSEGLLRQVNLIHYKLMRLFGWRLEYIDEHAPLWKQYENNHVPSDVESDASIEPVKLSSDVYRSTTLSQLPGQYISDRLHDSFEALVMLPLDSIVLRAVAQCYVTSHLAKTSAIFDSGGSLYLPFGGGPLSAVRSYGLTAGVWTEVGLYMSRLGLSLALNACVDTLVFFTAYGLSRWQGIRNFGWGTPKPLGEKED